MPFLIWQAPRRRQAEGSGLLAQTLAGKGAHPPRALPRAMPEGGARDLVAVLRSGRLRARPVSRCAGRAASSTFLTDSATTFSRPPPTRSVQHRSSSSATEARSGDGAAHRWSRGPAGQLFPRALGPASTSCWPGPEASAGERAPTSRNLAGAVAAMKVIMLRLLLGSWSLAAGAQVRWWRGRPAG